MARRWLLAGAALVLAFPAWAQNPNQQHGPFDNQAGVAGALPDGTAARPFNIIGGSPNLIDNPGMDIDQRYVGAATAMTAIGTSYFGADRWFAQYETYHSLPQVATTDQFQVRRVADGPPGAPYCVQLQVLKAYPQSANDGGLLLGQVIEGPVVRQLAWGTSQAQPITLAFAVKASVAGIYTFAVQNDTTPSGGARTVPNRSYVGEFVVAQANVWQQVQASIPGDQSGTWKSAIGTIGAYIQFVGQGIGGTGYSRAPTPNVWAAGNYIDVTGSGQVAMGTTVGATLELTRVQLVPGPVMSPYVVSDYGDVLRRARRFYRKSWESDMAPGMATVTGSVIVAQTYSGNTTPFFEVDFGEDMALPPAFTFYSVSGAAGNVFNNAATTTDVPTHAINTSRRSVQGGPDAATALTPGGYFRFHYTADTGL